MPHEAMLATLREAVLRRRLRPLDLAFAQFIAERDANAETALILLSALVSRHLADGHPCLDLDILPALAAEHDWPSEWLNVVSEATYGRSPVLADTFGVPDAAPLVLDHRRLYLRRYWNYECQVARAIDSRLVQSIPVHDSLPVELQRLFPSSAQNPDWQRIACALATRGTFNVITGGPGTGKTTTVIRLLALLQALHLRTHASPLRMRLAAPTGKAAARLNASIAAQRVQLDVSEAVRLTVPSSVDTLHRLLGTRPDSRQFRHHRAHPLHLDVLVIDEASMVDLEMMAAVLDALPAHARLVLLGDKDQLSSVEAGAVLGDLCQRAGAAHYSLATAEWIRGISRDDITAYISEDVAALDQHVTMLHLSHRFAISSGIGRLAAAVNGGDIDAVHTLLDVRHSDIAWQSDDNHAAFRSLVIDGDAARYLPASDAQSPRGYKYYLDSVKQRPAADADESAYQHWAHIVLNAYSRFQLLCALRHGPNGVEGLNRRVADLLFEEKRIESDRGWYEGRPVMVTRNDYSLGLMNGDVGVALRRRGPDGVMRLYVAFSVPQSASVTSMNESSTSTIRFVLSSRLNDVDTVYAMTVHKSQGSEFEHTALVLPDEANAALTRELLYTGITRARRWFSLMGTKNSIDQAIAQSTRRYSGLTERMAR